MQRSSASRPLLVIGCIALSSVIGGVTALAHKGATGVVKERMELMERYDELTDRVFAMLHDDLPYSVDAVRKAAGEIKKTSGAHLVKLFPKGSDDKPSKVTDDIWKDMDSFNHFAEMLQLSANAVVDLADKKPEGTTSLPRKWEDVPAMGMGRGSGRGPGMMGRGGPGRGPGMMGQGGAGRGPGMMGQGGAGRGPGMMSGNLEGAVWHLAHVCNTCHQAFRKEE